jgi:hypothetical protein
MQADKTRSGSVISYGSTGHFLALLHIPELIVGFGKAFFNEPFSIGVTRENTNEELTYYIEQSPPSDTKAKFGSCIKSL